MAALMGLPVKFVFSHDSIGIGRNGPTHQPVEILASLRAMPNMLVLRPADAVEAAECWEIAFEHRSGPSTLVFARQALPHVRRMHTQREPVAARRLRARRGRGRAARSHAAGHRLRGGARAGRARRAAGGRHADRRGLDAELGAVRGAGRRLPVERARRPAPCAWVAKRRCASAGTAGSASAAASSA